MVDPTAAHGAGRHLMVVYEEIDVDTVYPVTAYDVPRRQRPCSALSATGD